MGAWIETLIDELEETRIDVAPLVGAGIETQISYSKNSMSSIVAPLVGAWIET